MYRNSPARHPRMTRATMWSTALVAAMVFAQPGVADPIFSLTPLVTDDQDALAPLGFGEAATVDPNLINPWGISLGPTAGPFWVSNQGTNTSTLYTGEGERFPIGSPLVVNIPHVVQPAAGPTGQVFAGGAGLLLPGTTNEGLFFFANLDGSISGWSPGLADLTTAQVVVPANNHGPAIYTGLALADMGGNSFLYAANNMTGQIDVFNSNYAPTTLGAGAFASGPNPDGLAPFNVQNIGGLLYVTYAIPGEEADEAPLGSGFVNVFMPDGTFVRRIESDQFASPWGLTLAPDEFGEFANALLIGNFNDAFGLINAFDPATGEFLGTMLNSEGNQLIIPYLWGLAFGNGDLSDEDDLYFAAGIGDELHGLFGEIGAVTVDEPGTAGLLLTVLVGMIVGRRGTLRRYAMVG